MGWQKVACSQHCAPRLRNYPPRLRQEPDPGFRACYHQLGPSRRFHSRRCCWCGTPSSRRCLLLPQGVPGHYLIAHGARENSFRKQRTIAECLADEIVNAANGSSNSYAIKKKDEIERVAKANR